MVSIFGAMFAPKPFDVAKEMVRVTRPGGRIVMGNWIPGDPTLVAQILKISSSYSPPPPEGFVSPMTWGIESNVIERFRRAGVPAERISFARDTYTFNFPGAPSEFVAEFRKYYGPTMNAFDAAEKNGKAADLAARARDAVREPEQERKPRRDVHSRDVPARDRGCLNALFVRLLACGALLASLVLVFLARDGFARWPLSPYPTSPASSHSWDEVFAALRPSWSRRSSPGSST